MSSVPEPERTRQFWVMQEIFGAAVVFTSFVPILAFHLVGVWIAAKTRVENPIFFVLAASAAALTVSVLVLFIFRLDYDEAPTSDVRRLMFTVDALLSGGLSGFVYWFVAYWTAPLLKKNTPDGCHSLGEN